MIGGKEVRAVSVTVAGWVLVVAGVAALILPGPGLLLLLAGLILLSQRYDWAASRVEPVKKKAFGMARAGVASVPRILLSATGAAALIAVGIVWWIDPRIPEIGPIGPDLPLGGWTTGISVVLSGLVAAALLIYSIRRWRGEAIPDE
jgi:Putative transmembrane protein (PGPGW)